MAERAISKFQTSAVLLSFCMGIKVPDEFEVSYVTYEIFCRCWSEQFQRSCLTLEESSSTAKVIS